MIEFFLECDPPTATAQERKVSTRNGYPMYYDPDGVKYARQLLTLLLMSHRPKERIKSPVELTVYWRFRAKSHKPTEWRATKPDTDNLQKLLKDVMTKCGFWQDDALVVREIIEKSWEKTPGIYIRIRTLGKYRTGHEDANLC